MTESPTEHFEHAEHAEHAAHSGDSFLSVVSVSIAVLAIAAAALGSLESLETAAGSKAKNNAILYQNRVTDQWNFYQAKSIKKNLYEISAASNEAKREEYEREAKRYEEETHEIQKEAKELQAKTEEELKEASHHEHRHHVLTGAVTFFHVAIAIATISIITRGHRWPFYTALALAVGGLVTAGLAYR